MSYDLKLDGGDLAVNSDGSVKRIFNAEKLQQDIVKIILTPQGSSKLYPWYGSPMNKRVIGRQLDPKILDTEMTSSLQLAINTLKELQRLQEADGQYVSPSEVISQIIDVRVDPSPFDARAFNVVVVVATRRGSLIEESFTVTV